MVEPPGFRDYVTAREVALLRTAWMLTGDWHQAQDLVQTALIRAWPRWRRICEGGDPDAYVTKIVVNAYLAENRRLWRRREVVSDSLPERLTPDEYAAADLRDVMARLLPSLPSRQRAVLILRYFDDLTETQTAEVLGCSVGTVKSHNARALAALRATCLRYRSEEAQ